MTGCNKTISSVISRSTYDQSWWVPESLKRVSKGDFKIIIVCTINKLDPFTKLLLFIKSNPAAFETTKHTYVDVG